MVEGTENTPEPAASESYRERHYRLTGHALDTCPDCGGPMREREGLARPRAGDDQQGGTSVLDRLALGLVELAGVHDALLEVLPGVDSHEVRRHPDDGPHPQRHADRWFLRAQLIAGRRPAGSGSRRERTASG